MIRGTTAKITFNVPIDTTKVSTAFVTFVCDKKVVLDKPLNELVLEENKIIAKLSQAETLSFTANSRVFLQLRVKLVDGTAIASRIKEVTVREVLKEGVI